MSEPPIPTPPLTMEQRKDQMFAAQTQVAALSRLIYESQQRGDSTEVVGTLIERKAQAEATWLLLSTEIHTAMMSANLETFMIRQEADTTRVLEAVRGLGGQIDRLKEEHLVLLEGQATLASRVNDFGERLDEAEATIQSHNESRDRSIAERAALEHGRRENREAIEQVRKDVESMRYIVDRIAARVLGTEAPGDE